jgi:hypothetical protein
MTKTVDISGMDKSRAQYGYEWGCQVIMFRALDWLKRHTGDNTQFKAYKNIIGIMTPENPAAKEMEKFALDHEKVREFGATGAMVQYALLHAMQRNKLGEEGYFAEFADDPERIFDFNEGDAFPVAGTTGAK